MICTVVGCGGSSDELAGDARDVALARLGAQQAFDETREISCGKTRESGSSRTYVCRGEITPAGSASPHEVAVTVVCDADRKTCIR